MGGIVLVLLALTGMFMMFVILLQRGRGGGLAGALGGAGGQSAFGTKAGDVFTRITVAIALVWVLLACTAGFALRPDDLYSGGENVETKPAGVGAAAEEDESAQQATDGEGDEAMPEPDLAPDSQPADAADDAAEQPTDAAEQEKDQPAAESEQ